jgi:hypothetical protein
LVIFVHIVFTIFHPPAIVPNEIILKHAKGTQIGKSFTEVDREAAIIAAPIIHITF